MRRLLDVVSVLLANRGRVTAEVAEIDGQRVRGNQLLGSSDPLVRNYGSTNSKCFVWCRLGSSAPFFLSLSCTELVPRIVASLADKVAPFFSCLPALHPFRAYTVARPIGTRSGGLAMSWTARVRYHSTTAAPSYLSH